MRWLRLSKALLVAGLTLLLTACVTHELQTDLSEREAQEIVVLLHEHSIDAFATKSAGEKKGEEKHGEQTTDHCRAHGSTSTSRCSRLWNRTRAWTKQQNAIP